MATQWYVVKNGDRRGPYTAEELQALADEGILRPRDLVWCEGMHDWVQAKSVVKPSHAVPSVRRRRDEDDHDEDRSARRRSQFPGKLVSPAFFLFAIFMFLLPWVDVRCNGFTAVSQSGLQTCFGDFSESIVMAERRRRNEPGEPGFRMNEERVQPAPLMWFYGAFILAGLILGLVLPIGTPRMVALTLSGVLGFVLVMIQLTIGFPIAAQVSKANADPNLRRELQNQQMFPFPQPMFVAPPARADIVWVSTTPWLWFGAIMTLGVTGALALEHGVIFADRKRRRYR